MIVKGIRLPMRIDNFFIELRDVLDEINNGDEFYWSILGLWMTGDLGLGQSVLDLENRIKNLENGLFISWEDLNDLAKKIWQTIEISVIGCKDKKLLLRYEDDQEMYETCDIVIQMIDSSYWEIFSKDERLVNRLAEKFKNTEFLNSDFEK